MNLKEIYALVDYLVEEKLNQINLPKGNKGPRGLRGFDGKDFSWEENKSEILHHIKENSLTFEKLSEDQVFSLRGETVPRGLRGYKGFDGKDFSWEENKSEIFNRIDSNKLKFTDFTPDEIESLKGQRGYRGQKGTGGQKGASGKDGNDFSWDDHLEDVVELIGSNKLKFSDLTSDEVESITGKDGVKGAKGLAGKDGSDGVNGQDFSWEDHRKEILKRVDDNKLKFSDFTEDEIYSLKGSRGYRGQKGVRGSDGPKGLDGKAGKTGIPGVQGIQGLNGLSGRSGLDGEDGENAPVIIDINLREDRGTFYFIFLFDNGSRIETRSIDKPVVESIIQNTVMYAGGGSSTGGGASVLEVYKDNILVGLSESLNFEGDNITVTYDPLLKRSTITVAETQTCIPILDEGTAVTTCLKSMDFVGDGVTIENLTNLADWALLSDVTSMANYTVGDTGNLVVNIPQQEVTAKLGLVRIASGPVSKFDLVRLVSSTHVSKGSSDTSSESKVSGIALNTAADGEDVSFVMFGIVEDVSFTFPLNSKLFLQSDGSLNTTPPSVTGEFVVSSGESLGTGAIFIKIQEPEEIV